MSETHTVTLTNGKETIAWEMQRESFFVTRLERGSRRKMHRLDAADEMRILVEDGWKPKQ